MYNGKAIIYERDYRELRNFFNIHTYSKNHQDVFMLAQESGIFKAINNKICELPHIINPKAKEAYDDCLVMLERYAVEFGGRVCGVVSYEIFDAYVYLDLPFQEFTYDRIEELRFIANNARSVCFTITDENLIRLSVCFSYFERIGDADIVIEEELKKHPELCAMLENLDNDEVIQILSDPWIVAMIEPQAEKAGMTVEEYVRSIQTMINENPEQLMAWLDKKLKDMHNKDQLYF